MRFKIGKEKKKKKMLNGYVHHLKLTQQTLDHRENLLQSRDKSFWDRANHLPHIKH